MVRDVEERERGEGRVGDGSARAFKGIHATLHSRHLSHTDARCQSQCPLKWMGRHDKITMVIIRQTFTPPSEYVGLALANALQDDLRARELYLAVVRQVAAHPRQLRLPNFQERVNRAFADLKRGQVGQEIISDEEDKHDPVVDRALEIEGEGGVGDVELDFEVLAEDGHVEEDEWLFVVLGLFWCGTLGRGALRSVVAFLATLAACRARHVLIEHIFTQNSEMRLVCS